MRHIPHWLRERTAEERAWERAWLKKMRDFERELIAAGFKVRPKHDPA
jgi:hypothetical protein